MLHFELKRTVAVPSLHHQWNREHGDGDGPYVGPYDLPPSRRQG
jgi:hypothetical protein